MPAATGFQSPPEYKLRRRNVLLILYRQKDFMRLWTFILLVGAMLKAAANLPAADVGMIKLTELLAQPPSVLFHAP